MKLVTKNEFSSNYIDLLSEKVGGKALSCSDDWFASVQNLVKSGRGEFIQGKFVDTGQWMDGWESRRSFGRHYRNNLRVEFDTAILSLGIPGIIKELDIDTNHFTGNAPEFASVLACFEEGDPNEHSQWFEILEKSSLEANSQNIFQIDYQRKVSHLQLNIYPDGGVARFRAYGVAEYNPDNYAEGELVDLASVVNGGVGLLCSDMFYSSPTNLLMPKPGINMGDGWETKRRRDNGHDWNIVRLGVPGDIRKVVVDTSHFKGNFPDKFSLEGIYVDHDPSNFDDCDWQVIIPKMPLYADREHLFIKQITPNRGQHFTHVRLNIFPDGGVSRLRIFGKPEEN